MSRGGFLARWAWYLGFRGFIDSPRVSTELKVLLLPLVVLTVVGNELWWIVTGRGPRLRRLLGNDLIVVGFPKWRSTVFERQLAELAMTPTVEEP